MAESYGERRPLHRDPEAGGRDVEQTIRRGRGRAAPDTRPRHGRRAGREAGVLPGAGSLLPDARPPRRGCGTRKGHCSGVPPHLRRRLRQRGGCLRAGDRRRDGASRTTGTACTATGRQGAPRNRSGAAVRGEATSGCGSSRPYASALGLTLWFVEVNGAPVVSEKQTEGRLRGAPGAVPLASYFRFTGGRSAGSHYAAWQWRERNDLCQFRRSVRRDSANLAQIGTETDSIMIHHEPERTARTYRAPLLPAVSTRPSKKTTPHATSGKPA